MTALRKILIEEEPVVTTNAMVARAPTPKLYVVATKAPIEATEATPEAAGGALKNILLFFAAPFIGLAYIVAFPLVGIAVLALVAARAAAKIEAVRTVGLALKHVVMQLPRLSSAWPISSSSPSSDWPCWPGWVVVPCLQPARGEQKRSKERAMDAPRKVLVVDDDPVVRKSFDRVLSGKGYAVITAENGEEALRKLNEEKYDAVYTDIRMPGMSGLEVAEEVKARKPWTPVVIITGYGTEAAEARAKAAGVSSFLHKPLSPEMIENSARDVMAAPVAAAEVLTAAVDATLPKAATSGSALKNILMFFAAPFIGLAYIIAFPFIGLALLLWIAGKAAVARPRD